MAMHMEKFSMSFEIFNTERQARAFTIKAKQGELAELRPLVKEIGRELLEVVKAKYEAWVYYDK